jgi:hypothetical protein
VHDDDDDDDDNAKAAFTTPTNDKEQQQHAVTMTTAAKWSSSRCSFLGGTPGLLQRDPRSVVEVIINLDRFLLLSILLLLSFWLFFLKSTVCVYLCWRGSLLLLC